MLGLQRFELLTPLPMIPQQMETQFIASRHFPVPVLGIIPSPSSAPFLFGKSQYQDMETQTAPEHPRQLGCQTFGLQDPPQISPVALRKA